MPTFDEALLARIRTNDPTLTSLDLERNHIGAEGAKELSLALKDNCTLTSLGLWGNKIGGEGAKELSLALKDNHTLTWLDLGDNNIGDAGAKALSLVLKDNHTLAYLDLGCNKIGKAGTKELSLALKDNRTLTSLSLRINNIEDVGVKELSLVLKDNHTLASLDLGWNSIGGVDVKELSLVLKDNHTVTSLDLGWNSIGDVGAEALSLVLKDNYTLTLLKLANNNIRNEGAKALILALKDNHTLTSLDLWGNKKMWNVKMKEVAALIKRNEGLCNQLHQAVQQGDNPAVKRLIEQGVSVVSITGNDRYTPLHWAVQAHQPAIIKTLRTLVIDAQWQWLIKQKDRQGNKPLVLAQKLGHQDIVLLLQAQPTTIAPVLLLADKNSRDTVINIEKKAALSMPYSIPLQEVVNTQPPVVANAPALEELKTDDHDEKVPINFQDDAIKKQASIESPSRKNTGNAISTQQLSLEIPYDTLKRTQNMPLGQGSFGMVYLGMWGYQQVAIKELKITNLSEQGAKEFRQEVDIMAKLRSRYVVQLYGVCSEKSPYCIVMEYMSKGSLDCVLEDPNVPWDWSQRLQVSLEISYGLAYLHQQNILHRDLKSQNVLLDEHLHAKLTDFGISKVKMTYSETLTQGLKGTITHIAPEIMEGNPTSPKSDIYSYGMILWEIAARSKPYKAIGPVFNPHLRELKIMNFVLENKREEIKPDCKPKFAQLIRFCWDKDPKKRPTIDDAIKELQATDILNDDNNNAALAAPKQTGLLKLFGFK